jgi:Na+-driven multidrug efflux pump
MKGSHPSITASRNHPAEIRRTLELAAPVMIGLIASFGMNFVDTVMAGRLPEKDTALAALAIGGALWSAMLMFTLGTLMALQPTVAQLDGAGRKPEAGAAMRQAFWLAVVLSVPFAALMANGGLVRIPRGDFVGRSGDLPGIPAPIFQRRHRPHPPDHVYRPARRDP